MRRIFTKVWNGFVAVQTTDELTENGYRSWLAQEPIEIIGASMSIVNKIPSENDGFAFLGLELSQVGLIGQDGAILKCAAEEGWNTTPAGVDKVGGHIAVTFPAGYTVPVKEEGYLYLNLEMIGKSAGASVFEFEVIIYYTKKGH
ncbi:hypothetical protein ES703_121675 [subsurface metagenome]